MQNITNISQDANGNVVLKLVDTATGTKYKLVVTNGVLSIEEV